MTSPTSVSPLQDDVGLRGPLLFAVAGLLVFGLLYSLAGATLGRLAFPAQATGSTIERDGRVVGSRWLAQPFADARYFRARPSAADYDPMAAAGSNLARSNPDLAARIDELRAEVAAREGIAPDAVPIELVTRSGGGLDPHVTPAGARAQAARVARARGLDVAAVQRLIDAHTEPRTFGVLGGARVNVLELNLALDAAPAAGAARWARSRGRRGEAAARPAGPHAARARRACAPAAPPSPVATRAPAFAFPFSDGAPPCS